MGGAGVFGFEGERIEAEIFEAILMGDLRAFLSVNFVVEANDVGPVFSSGVECLRSMMICFYACGFLNREVCSVTRGLTVYGLEGVE